MGPSFIKTISTFVLGAIMYCAAGTASADNISFNYQGRVKVENQPFTGTGLLKLAILNTSASAVLWSNDGTVGAMSGNVLPEPSGALAQQIVDGVFSVAVGDESISGMAPLDSAVMVSDTPLRLRVWFSDGQLGFQQLNPDHKLIDLTLNKIQTGINDFTIYVNDETGNDANNGLTPQTAKKTITGAVDILPEKIRCNITVRIAAGTYREMVIPHGISVAYGKTLLFLGDEIWTPASSGIGSVIIDGANSDNTPVRDYCFYARQCTGIVIEGITMENAAISGMKIENGTYTINRCLSRNNPVGEFASGNGFLAGPQCYASFNECTSTNNGFIGFAVDSNSRARLSTCTATLNNIGVLSGSNSVAQFYNYNDFSSNSIGVQANAMSDASVWPSSSNATRTRIQNNTEYAVRVNWGSMFTPMDAIMTGNAALYSRYYGTIIGVDPQ